VVFALAFVAVELRVASPMIEFSLLSDRNFLGAVVVALVISFGMLGVFFFLALYMQNILGYSPLEAGIRFLPSTLMIVIIAPLSGRLADRYGPRWLIGAGLVVLAASLMTFTTITTHSSYLDLLPGFMLLGIGIAMTMSPMTSAAMNAVAVEKAGIASGVLSTFRMVGGSLGVAVTGAIFQSLSAARLDTLLTGSGIPAPQRAAIADGLGAGGSQQALAGLPGAQAKQAAAAAQEAFVYALGHAMGVCAAVTLIGALVGTTAIRSKRRSIGLEASRAAVNPGGSEVAPSEALSA
jgi:MFS family permease